MHPGEGNLPSPCLSNACTDNKTTDKLNSCIHAKTHLLDAKNEKHATAQFVEITTTTCFTSSGWKGKLKCAHMS